MSIVESPEIKCDIEGHFLVAGQYEWRRCHRKPKFLAPRLDVGYESVKEWVFLCKHHRSDWWDGIHPDYRKPMFRLELKEKT